MFNALIDVTFEIIVEMISKEELEKSNLIFETFLDCRLEVLTYLKLDYQMFCETLLNSPSFSSSYVNIHCTKSGKESVWFFPISTIFNKDIFVEFEDLSIIKIEVLFVKVTLQNISIFNLPYFKKFKIKKIRTISFFVSRIIEETRINVLMPGNSQITDVLHKSLLFYTLREQYLLFPVVFDTIREDFEDNRLFTILSYIDNHFNEELSLDKIGSIVGLSTEYVSQFFKRKTGLSLSKYIVDFKMIKAVQILIENNDSITILAQKCGFTDLPYFNRRFKTAFKMNPTEAKQKFHLMFASSGALELLSEIKEEN